MLRVIVKNIIVEGKEEVAPQVEVETNDQVNNLLKLPQWDLPSAG